MSSQALTFGGKQVFSIDFILQNRALPPKGLDNSATTGRRLGIPDPFLLPRQLQLGFLWSPFSASRLLPKH